jgi:hypothetical protein
MNAEPAELEIRNPKPEIRNKFKKMEISKTENEALGLNHRWTRILQEGTELTEGEQGGQEKRGNFLAGCEQFRLLQCRGLLRLYSLRPSRLRISRRCQNLRVHDDFERYW